MAKKKTPQVEESKVTEEGVFVGRDGNKFYKEGGKGKKPCPKCGVFVGARHSGKCANPDCDNDFPLPKMQFLTREESKKRREQALGINQQQVGIGEAIERLKKVRAYAEDFGGVDGMLDQVAKLEEITMQVGGIDGLKEALKALKEF